MLYSLCSKTVVRSIPKSSSKEDFGVCVDTFPYPEATAPGAHTVTAPGLQPPVVPNTPPLKTLNCRMYGVLQTFEEITCVRKIVYRVIWYVYVYA